MAKKSHKTLQKGRNLAWVDQMKFQHKLKFFEKCYIRPLLRKIRPSDKKIKMAAAQDVHSESILDRIKILEDRINELEQLVQEDLGLKFFSLDDSKSVPPRKASEG